MKLSLAAVSVALLITVGGCAVKPYYLDRRDARWDPPCGQPLFENPWTMVPERDCRPEPWWIWIGNSGGR